MWSDDQMVDLGMLNQTISATEFKAKCLALIDQVNQNGGIVTITKRGQPVGVLRAAKKAKFKSSKGSWARMFPGMPKMEVRDFDLTHLYNPERML